MMVHVKAGGGGALLDWLTPSKQSNGFPRWPHLYKLTNETNAHPVEQCRLKQKQEEQEGVGGLRAPFEIYTPS